MKKRLLYCFLFLLSALTLPASFSASHGGLPVASDETNCPLPAPTWLIATNITPTSISLMWEQAQLNIFFKIEGYDITGGFPLPTYYTSNNTITYSGLTPGHTYQFDVSASQCLNGPFGEKISIQKTTGHIIIDIVVELQNQCTPNNTQPTGLNQTYNFCVQQSTTNEPYTNGFVGLLQYDASNAIQFGVATKDGIAYFGPMTLNGQPPNSNFNFPDNSSHPEYAECYYANNLVFRVEFLNYTYTNNGWSNLTITFFGSYRNFSYCPASNLPCFISGGGQGKEPEPTGVSGEAASSRTLEEEEGVIETQLSPNPFSESATLRYELTEADPVEITLYDAIGRLVQVVEKTASRELGQYEATISGTELPGGVYFLHLTTAQTRKTFTLVKRE